MATSFNDAGVKRAFDEIEEPHRSGLLKIRELIFRTAAKTDGVGEVAEALKWGQPSYLTPKTKSGSTIRLGVSKGAQPKSSVFFHCQTDLVRSFREMYPDKFEFEGNRAVLLPLKGALPQKELAHCIALALTYHQRKKKAG